MLVPDNYIKRVTVIYWSWLGPAHESWLYTPHPNAVGKQLHVSSLKLATIFGSIYTMKICKCYKSGVFCCCCFVLAIVTYLHLERQFLNLYLIPLKSPLFSFCRGKRPRWFNCWHPQVVTILLCIACDKTEASKIKWVRWSNIASECILLYTAGIHLFSLL